jgi:hypothetical protein
MQVAEQNSPGDQIYECGGIYGPKPYESIGIGTVYGPKPYKFTCLGDIYGPNRYTCIGFGDIYGPKPYNLCGFFSSGAWSRNRSGLVDQRLYCLLARPAV